MVRILLAMPQGLLRGALKYVLSTHPDMDVIAERDAVEATIEAVRTDSPDVTVLDLELLNGPGRDPAGAARAAHSELPDSKILVLVDPRRPGVGAQIAAVPPTIGFLAQTASPERVVDAVLRLAAGEPVVDADLLMAALMPTSPLTERELRVLEVAALGTPVKEIARTLSLSPGTVRNHLSRIIAKTGARNRIEAIHLSKEKGWI
ncbi:two-component system response regulator DesR [Catenuloplanes nepalensis]|uniref:Two-component system response regulator DesR n=1 Tax=Catenuloplanes nepalensis TaxID=587533 RepID=A0ABT9MLW1_9ACTN|nr:response regulator transcription factor [Catenuloplanes nepalensis]MDP9792407.1 two-component system response regulator DesR [Catenuloplanes nepalensis]